MTKIISFFVVAVMLGGALPLPTHAQSSEGGGINIPIPRSGSRSGSSNRVTALFAPPIAQTQAGSVLGETGFRFASNMTVGFRGEGVTELQKRLKAEGFFSVEPTGYFGTLTLAAVKAYQSAHGISNTGYVGALTLAQLNSSIASAPVDTAQVASLKTQVAGLIQQAIQLLQAQLAAVIAAGSR